jgi:hypothetical protein
MRIHTLMTTVRNIQAILDKTDVRGANCNLFLHGDGLSAIRFEIEYMKGDYGDGYETFTRKITHDEFITFGPEDITGWCDNVITEAYAWVDAIPTAEEREHQAFMNQLGRLIDKGRDVGIEVDFLNPLTTIMKKLASNALEDKRNS